MTLSFECTCCGKDVQFKAPRTSDHIEEIDEVCPNCDVTYTIEVYYDESGNYLGFQPFDYGWYMEHGDEDFVVNI